MPYVRITTVVAKDGQVAEVERRMREISAYYSRQPGYVQGYFLSPHETISPGRYGRVGIWEDEASAVDAAQTEHALALRAALLRASEADSNLELSFDGSPDIS